MAWCFLCDSSLKRLHYEATARTEVPCAWPFDPVLGLFLLRFLVLGLFLLVLGLFHYYSLARPRKHRDQVSEHLGGAVPIPRERSSEKVSQRLRKKSSSSLTLEEYHSLFPVETPATLCTWGTITKCGKM